MPTSFTPHIQAALTEFEPDIQRLGVKVRPMPPVYIETGAWGYYDHYNLTVWLRPNLAFIQARSTLAHELAHARHKHIGQHEHQEREAEAAAAEQLIGSPEKLGETARGLNLGGALTMALGIMPRDLKRYIEEHREAAADAILDALAGADWSTIPKPSDYRRQHQPLVYDQWAGNIPDTN